MDVFVYGTLTDPERVAHVVTEFEFVGPAKLDGLHRVEGQYPTLAPGGSVEGKVLRTPEIDALDAYEGVTSGLYVRVSVPMESDGDDESEAETAVQLYVDDPDELGADASWPGDGMLTERVESYVREREVVVRAGDEE